MATVSSAVQHMARRSGENEDYQKGHPNTMVLHCEELLLQCEHSDVYDTLLNY